MIKKYEKEVKDLKQELAMHDTLSNRGKKGGLKLKGESLMIHTHRNSNTLSKKWRELFLKGK
jgi:hypothetical protein